MHRSREGFFTAISATDTRALELFLAAGMRIEKWSLHEAANSDDPAMNALFLGHRSALTADACDLDAIIHGDFTDTGNGFLKGMCGADAIYGHIDKLIELQHRRAAAYVSFEAARPGLLQKCIDLAFEKFASAGSNESYGILAAGLDTASGLLEEQATATGLAFSDNLDDRTRKLQSPSRCRMPPPAMWKCGVLGKTFPPEPKRRPMEGRRLTRAGWRG